MVVNTYFRVKPISELRADNYSQLDPTIKCDYRNTYYYVGAVGVVHFRVECYSYNIYVIITQTKLPCNKSFL